MLYKVIAVLLAVILALNCCCIRSSATISYTSMPNMEDYPPTESGYNAYVKDMITYGAVNVSATVANPFLFVGEKVFEYFGIDKGQFDYTPQDLVGNAFSQYYNDPNYILQVNKAVLDNGDFQLRCIINTDNPPVISDDVWHDGFYNGLYGYFQFELLYKGVVVDKWYHAYNYKPTVYWGDWEWYYGSDGTLKGFVYYFKFGTSSSSTEYTKRSFQFDITDYVDGDVEDFTVEVPEDKLYVNCPQVYITDSDSTEQITKTFYVTYEGDKPTFVNTTNYNDKYYYNDNNQITYNNKNYYTYPVVDTHTDEQLAQLKNMIALMLTLAAAALSNGSGGDATDLSTVHLYMQQIYTNLTTNTSYAINNNNVLKQLLAVINAMRMNMISYNSLNAALNSLHGILEIEDTQAQLGRMETLLGVIASGTTAILAVISLEDLEELTEEEQSYLDVLAALIETISTFIPFHLVQNQMSEINNVILSGQPARDISINLFGENMTLLSVDFVNRISSALSVVKNLLSVFILYAWLKMMRKKMVDI